MATIPVHEISLAIGVVGVVVILWGLLLSAVRFIRAELATLRGFDTRPDRQELRHQLGGSLLLGLEFLIAADIIDTIFKPSLQDLAVLGAIVAIRTVIGFSLNWELSHADGRRF